MKCENCGQELMSLKANNCDLFIYNDRAVIVRKGLYALNAPNGNKETEIFYNTLSGIDYKKPNKLSGNGYISFLNADDIYKPHNWKFDVAELTQEENTVVMVSASGKIAKQSEKIYNFVMSKISESVGSDAFANQNSRIMQNQYVKDAVLQQPKPMTKREQIKDNKKNAVACCPKCGSISLSANKKGFGIGKAVIGASIAGPIGLVAGNINAKKIKVTCLNCGHQFDAGK